MKKLVVLLSLLLVSTAAIAAIGEHYIISPEGLLPVAGTSEGTTYSVQHAAGDISGITSSAAYASKAGLCYLRSRSAEDRKPALRRPRDRC